MLKIRKQFLLAPPRLPVRRAEFPGGGAVRVLGVGAGAGQLHQPVEQVELDVAEAAAEPLGHHRVEDRVQRGVEVEEHAWNRAFNQIPLFSWLNIRAKCDVWQCVATDSRVLK